VVATPTHNSSNVVCASVWWVMVSRSYGTVRKKSNHTAAPSRGQIPGDAVAQGGHRDDEGDQHQRGLGVRQSGAHRDESAHTAGGTVNAAITAIRSRCTPKNSTMVLM
jgi:hypothetical protein